MEGIWPATTFLLMLNQIIADLCKPQREYLFPSLTQLPSKSKIKSSQVPQPSTTLIPRVSPPLNQRSNHRKYHTHPQLPSPDPSLPTFYPKSNSKPKRPRTPPTALLHPLLILINPNLNPVSIPANVPQSPHHIPHRPLNSRQRRIPCVRPPSEIFIMILLQQSPVLDTEAFLFEELSLYILGVVVVVLEYA